ncbi:MAG: methyltransferase domain-containing protein [Candidatus Pacebacteria bacterium]|nr:methyltransferase domain-containing protein [Candidatus Paceibacterota bacterium]
MKYILFPGRHLLTTAFQKKYILEQIANSDEQICIIFAITSANQRGSRYNPLPLWVRALGVDRFGQELQGTKPTIQYRIVPVPHFGLVENFTELVIKYVQDSLHIDLHPENTNILCSTQALAKRFRKNNFIVYDAEFNINTQEYTEKTPNEILKNIIESDFTDIEKADDFSLLSLSGQSLWKTLPQVYAHVHRLWNDPLLTESGSLTETRDYATYAYGMGHNQLLEFKYQDVKDAIIPGRIVDEGCADGSLLARIITDEPDSDYIGVDITAEFIARCQERQRLGDFGNSYINFYQRNITEEIFKENTISTTLCNSTTHEIYSYGNGEKDIHAYLAHKYKQTQAGGRIIIRDVVGPEDKNKIIYAKLSDTDGENMRPEEVKSWSDFSPETLEGLSTLSRFYLYAETYLRDLIDAGRRDVQEKINYSIEKIDDTVYIKTSFKNITEYITKKDYTDNWLSESNEQFAFWSFSEWEQALEKAGFSIVHNGTTYSKAYTNQWIVENRFRGSVELFEKTEQGLTTIPYPPTNMVLVGEK